MKVAIGQKLRLKRDTSHYTGNYAGTLVTITKTETDDYSIVVGFDGREFMCPNSYFDDDDYPWYYPEIEKTNCTCGADITYGSDCPGFYHYPFCPLYRIKE